MKHTVRITVAIKLPSKNYFIFGRTWWSRTTRSPSSPSQPISPACRPIGAASTCHLGQARPCFTGTPHIKAAQDFSRAAYTPSQKIYLVNLMIQVRVSAHNRMNQNRTTEKRNTVFVQVRYSLLLLAVRAVHAQNQ